MGRLVPKEQTEMSAADLFDVIVEELIAYFSDPRATGLVLSEGEAKHIAGGIVQRAKPGLPRLDSQ
jgi:hypothetical protein